MKKVYEVCETRSDAIKLYEYYEREVSDIRVLLQTELVHQGIKPKDLDMVFKQLHILESLFMFKEQTIDDLMQMSTLDEFFQQCREYVDFYKGESNEKTTTTTNDRC